MPPIDPQGIGHVDEPCEVERDLAPLLKSLGFDPGVPVFRAQGAGTFGGSLGYDYLADVIDALFGGEHDRKTGARSHDPLILSCYRRVRENTNAWSITFFLDLYQVIHKPFIIRPDGPMTTQTGQHFRHPDWYLRGSVASDNLWDPPLEPPAARVHIYIETDVVEDGYRCSKGLVVQVVTEPSGADLDTPLMWGVGVPEEFRA